MGRLPPSMTAIHRKLRFRLPAILIAYCLVALLAVGLTLYVSWKLEGGAAAINDMGSERMRSYRIAFLLSERVRGAGDRDLEAEIRGELQTFETVLVNLERGDPSRPLLMPQDPAIRAMSADVRSRWEETIRPMVEQVLAAGSEPERRRLMALYHPEVDRFVALIDTLVGAVERDNSRNTALLRSLQFGLLALAIGGTVVLMYLLFLYLLGPLRDLEDGIQRMKDEDFSVRLPESSGDELGDLARGFNRMAGHLQDLYTTLEQRVRRKTRSLEEKNRELSTLYSVSTFLNEPASTEELCRGFIRRLMELLVAAAGSVRLVDPRSDDIVMYVQEGLGEEFLKHERCLKMGDCLCGEAARSAVPVIRVFAELPAPAELHRCRLAGYRTVSVFTIRFQKQVLGIFNLYFHTERSFSPQEHQMLETLGQHLGIAIENQRLVSRERELAVSEERNLLAQELHDSIAQSLAFLNLQAQMLERALREGDSAGSEESLAQIREGIQESYDDVRELLVHFRTRPGAADLGDALRATLEKFEGQTGIRAEFVQTGTGLPLPAESRMQVLHIVQEALSNVRKHSGADRVRVDVTQGDTYRVRVADNGRGFPAGLPESVGDAHVGLKIMRERAHRIGGKLKVHSPPGSGVVVELILPVVREAAA